MDSDSEPRRAREVRYGGLLIFLTVAAAFRFAALGRQPLWLDEASDASLGARPFWSCVLGEFVHPPLYRTLLHFMVMEAGTSAFAVRLLPAVFGILAVPAIAVLARRLSSKVELTAVALAATSPFLIFYSQENRNYSLFILLSVVATALFLRFCDSAGGLSLYCGIAILLIYTHYLSVFVLLAHEAVYWRHFRIRARDWVLARVVLLLAFAPWFVWVAVHYQSESRLFIPLAGLIPLALLRFFLGYGIAASDVAWQAESLRSRILEEAPVVLPALLLFTWLLWRGIRSGWKPHVKTLFAWIVIVPWAVLTVLAPWLRLAHERYLAFQAPFLLLVIAAGICSLSLRRRAIAVLMVCCLVGFALAAYYAAPGSLFGYQFRYAKENWPGAASFIRTERADAVIIAPGYLSLALDRYSLGAARQLEMYSGSALPDFTPATHRVALVISHSGPEQEQLRATLDTAYARIAERTFPSQNGIRVIVYDVESRLQIVAGRTWVATRR